MTQDESIGGATTAGEELSLHPEGGDLAFVFARVPGKPPQFVARILESLQSYYAMMELEA